MWNNIFVRARVVINWNNGRVLKTSGEQRKINLTRGLIIKCKYKWIRFSAGIKSKLGICCGDRCFKRANVEINITAVNVKRCLCYKHAFEFQDILKK